MTSSSTESDPGSARAQLEDLLAFMVEQRASALSLSAGSPPRLRLDGRMSDLGEPAKPAAETGAMLRSILGNEQRQQLDAGGSVHFVHTTAVGRRVRAVLFRHDGGDAGVFQQIPDRARSLESLGLPPMVATAAEMAEGLVLVTGPRYSGKSTTLSALVETINRHQSRHIVTIESPIELIYESKQSMIAQREVGTHVDSFTTALWSSLREDADVIVVSELDGAEEISTALTAAATGNLVLATMQTPSAYRTLLRILDAYHGTKRSFVRSKLSLSLRMIVSQQLVPGTGRRGLQLATEVLTVSPAIANLIREDRIHQIPSAMQTGRGQNMILMDDSLARLVDDERILPAEALRRAADRDKFQGRAARGGR